MSYAVKEIFYTLQGEGANAGRPAVFCRFAGCNLWSGREEDRATAVCRFCDTDFVGTDGPGGGRFAERRGSGRRGRRRWPEGAGRPAVRRAAPAASRCCSWTTPLRRRACTPAASRSAVETNGTLPPPAGVDWICVSPKAGAPLARCAAATS